MIYIGNVIMKLTVNIDDPSTEMCIKLVIGLSRYTPLSFLSSFYVYHLPIICT